MLVAVVCATVELCASMAGVVAAKTAASATAESWARVLAARE